MGALKDLIVYQKAFKLAMEIFQVSTKFPKDERYSLTDQIRRCSRSVCANLAEAYRRRKYVPHFLSKTTDADAENSESQIWLEFSLACKYISNEEHINLLLQQQEVGKLIGYMLNNPDKFCK